MWRELARLADDVPVVGTVADFVADGTLGAVKNGWKTVSGSTKAIVGFASGDVDEGFDGLKTAGKGVIGLVTFGLAGKGDQEGCGNGGDE